ncbi:MAG: glycoside hydrolase family 3 C-terminal domain-containing protein, partial [Prevotella sp.]|nr:glycoside hydrolase family 3 C-terminal domain-containing protein [Prevotella sp.]
CGTTFKALKTALDEQLLTEGDIDKALMPLMMTRLKLGLLKPDKQCPYNEMDESVIGSEKHIALARKVAEESMVLLKNDGVLPLKKDIKTLFVTGAGAADAFWLMGNYFGISDRYCTYLQGIVSKVSNGTAVNYRPGVLESTPTRNKINWAVDEAAGADYTIVVMGNNGNLEGEEGEAIDSERGDRDGISLPESQMKFLRDIYALKKSGIIVVLTGGSPVDVREISQMADAIIMAWYPGQEGGYALGDLIFGDANFSGKLPVTFPADGKLLPDFEDYSMKGRTYKYMTDNIFYPFGFGLNYGKVEYGDLKVIANKKTGATVSVTLTNNSSWSVTEIPQVYVSAPGAGVSAPLQQLASFQRVTVEPGKSVEVRFDVPVERLMTVQEDGSSKLVRGEYVFTVANAAPSMRNEELGVSALSAKVKMK